MPINDDVCWVAKNVDFKRSTIIGDGGKILGLLTPKNFQSIYQLNPAKEKCNKEYLDNFYMANLKYHMLMKPWYPKEEDFKDHAQISKNNTFSFIPLVQHLTDMLSQLLGEADSTFFKVDWIPLAHRVIYIGTIFNLASILSVNIIKAMEKEVPKPEGKGTPFYYSGFLLDVLCAHNSFLDLNWEWTPKCLPIHVHFQELWEEHYKK